MFFQYTQTEQVTIQPFVNTDKIVSFVIPASQLSFTEPNFELSVTWTVKNGDNDLDIQSNIAPVSVVQNFRFKWWKGKHNVFFLDFSRTFLDV